MLSDQPDQQLGRYNSLAAGSLQARGHRVSWADEKGWAQQYDQAQRDEQEAA